MSIFKKATKSQSKLRLAIVGVAGAGKTYSALEIAKHLGSKIALIDTERGSASKYAGDVADFDVLELATFPPSEYVKAIKAAENEGYDVLVIDSLSHAWAGKGGALEMVDDAAARQKTRNTFTAWRDITPEQHALIEAILQSKCHVIATMRAKTAYELDNKVVTKVGLAPVQREGVEYEFDVIGDIDLEHKMVISKSRCAKLDGKNFRKPGKDIAEILMAWLSDGAPVVDPYDALLAKLRTCKDAETQLKLEPDARAIWQKLTAAQRQIINDEIALMRKRIQQAAADEAEAAAAEEALRAQEAAEQGEAPETSSSEQVHA